MRTRTLALLAALGLAGGAARAGDERILSFHSDLTVHPDASLTVTETIKVRSAAQQIKHGIYRDFPVVAPSIWYHKTYGFEVLSVRRDGRPEAYRLEGVEGNRRVYVGRKDVWLKPGLYTYTLRYRTTRQIRYFADHDELYWNANGTRWKFRIDRVTARATFPRPLKPAEAKLEGYTGRGGERGKDYACRLDAQGRAVFAATRPFGSGENLSIVVSFPKGLVREPARAEVVKQLLADNAMVGIAAIGLLAVLGFYLFHWSRVGRDPARGVIIPRFEPPEGLSPAAARYLLRMGYDGRCLSATLIRLAIAGSFTIDQSGGEYELLRQESNGTGLSGEEQRANLALRRKGKRLTLDSKNYKAFQAARDALRKGLRKTLGGIYFVRNGRYVTIGVVLSALTLAAVILSTWGPRTPALAFLSVWLSGWTVGVFLLLRQTATLWRAALGGKAKALVGAIGMSVFSSFFVVAELFVVGFLAAMATVWIVAAVLALALVNAVFHRLMKCPTPAGRKRMDAIEGFRMYLSTAEQDRLEYAHPPQRTPELFEKYLPYAVALDVENQWAGQFSDVLARAGEGGQAYRPGWYHGAALSSLGAAGFASGIGGSLSSAVSSACTSPSSSGSGGGGSSGGGGGGGGGGGW